MAKKRGTPANAQDTNAYRLGSIKNTGWAAEFVVRIWPNGYKIGNQKSFIAIPGGRIGHSAVTYRHALGNTGGTDGVYISWWPDEEMSFSKKDLGAQEGSSVISYRRDKKYETGDWMADNIRTGGSPTRYGQCTNGVANLTRALQRILKNSTTSVGTSCSHKDFLPGLVLEEEFQATSPVWWGLCGSRVVKWYPEYINKNRYKGASAKYNCSGAAVTALEVGGAGAYVPKPGGLMGKIFMAPMNVKEWGGDLRKVIDKLNKDSQIFSNLCGDLYPDTIREYQTFKRTDIWPYQKFRDASSLGWKYPRSSYIKNIDRALRKYHDTGTMWKENFEYRLNGLVKLFRHINYHVRNKPTSKRTRAVRILGSQVLGVLHTADLVWCDIANKEKFL